MWEVRTPQSGIEAVPAWGPPSDMKFLTCFTKKEANGSLINGEKQVGKIKMV